MLNHLVVNTNRELTNPIQAAHCIYESRCGVSVEVCEGVTGLFLQQLLGLSLTTISLQTALLMKIPF